MVSKALENAIEKIYQEISTSGKVTDNQLALIMIYESKNKNTINIDNLIKSGKKIVNLINQNLEKE